jgi:serine/threonine protein kinase
LTGIIEPFAAALQRGELPHIDDHLPRQDDIEILAELVHVELEFKLENGVEVAVTDYLAAYPQLAADRVVVMKLIEAEFRFRQRRDPLLKRDSFLSRYPEYAHDFAVQGSDSTKAYQPGSLPAKELGTVIAGKYKLLQQLGEGGMGTVFMADQIEPIKRRVAVKLIRSGMNTSSVMARFEAERQVLALMGHPNIAKVLDAGTTETQRPYFVMELVKGKPINEFCDEHKLSIADRLQLFMQVCAAVQHAHQKGIIHRDLKPTNILVESHDGKAVPKVIDFGLAKAMSGQQLSEQTLFTQLGMVVGTPLYMAPEQAAYNALDVDTRADIYALGVVLYELLTGSTPIERAQFRMGAFEEILRLIRDSEPPIPSKRLSTSESKPSVAACRQMEPSRLSKFLRGDLDWIVMKALAKERERRYETASGFAKDIERFINHEPVSAGPPSASYRLRKFVQRNRPQVVAVALVLVALLAGIVGTTWEMLEADKERYLAVTKEKEAVAASDAKEKALIAETEARKAEKKARDQAMEALKSLTEDIVENQMARGMQLTEENKEFMRKIIKHFEGFAAISADDADGRFIRAGGYYSVGNMRQRLGELKEAEEAYNDARTLQKQLVADIPTRAEFRRDLARSTNSLGLLFGNTGRQKEAERAHLDALALQKQLVIDFPSQHEIRQDLAITHLNLATVLSTTGRLKEGEIAFNDALTLQKQLVIDLPTNAEYRRLLSVSQKNIGLLYQMTGRMKRAEAAYNDSLDMRKRLVAEFPTKPDFRRDLSLSYVSIGLFLSTNGRAKEGEKALNEALILQKQLAADFPTRPDLRQELARSENHLGNLLRDAGRLKEAEAAYGSMLDIEKRLAADFPTRPEFRRELAISHNSLGLLLREQGRLKDAEEAYAAACKIQKQLVTDFLNQPDLKNDLAGSLVNLANLRLGQRSFQEAKNYLMEALPLHESALNINPQNPDYRRFYRNNLTTLIRTHAGLRDQASALQIAHKLRDLDWDPPSSAYDAACQLSLCILVFQKDDQTSKEERDKQVQFYGDEAMKMLSDAIAKGYKDVANMRQDTDLDSLRPREDFKRLMSQIGK